MLRASCGDDEAFESIYLAYHPRVLRVLTAMTSNHDQAEELSQEVFLRAFKARYRYRPKSLLITWLYRIARNVAFNSSRDRSALHAIQLQSEGRHSQFASIIEQADGPAHLKRKELRESVWEAIATLGARQRQALHEFYFGEQSYIDIAHNMQISTEAVKSLVSRARANLRIQLQPLVD